jgi:hypothetical protein
VGGGPGCRGVGPFGCLGIGNWVVNFVARLEYREHRSRCVRIAEEWWIP